MTLSADHKVAEFIDKIKLIDYPKHCILEVARKIVFECYPGSKERMMYGGIIFSLEDDFGGVFVHKNHVSFEFSNGYMFQDTENLLEGKGKFRRHLKIKTLDDHKLEKLDFFLKQI